MSEHSNETLWAQGGDPLVLLEELYPRRTSGSTQPQDRKSRMYLLACARQQWHRLPGVCRGLVEMAEHFADRPREREPIRAALAPIAEMLMSSEGEKEHIGVAGSAFADVKHTVESDRLKFSAFHSGPAERDSSVSDDDWRGLSALVYLPFLRKTPPFGWVPRGMHSVALLREVYYNPNQLVPFPDAWRDSRVLAIAQQVYDAREFSGMPILGDALEEAGCNSPIILSHCRDEPIDAHVRGCWVLDRVLDWGRKRG